MGNPTFLGLGWGEGLGGVALRASGPQQRRAPGPRGDTSLAGRDSWTSQGIYQLVHQAQAAAPTCGEDHSLSHWGHSH